MPTTKKDVKDCVTQALNILRKQKLLRKNSFFSTLSFDKIINVWLQKLVCGDDGMTPEQHRDNCIDELYSSLCAETDFGTPLWINELMDDTVLSYMNEQRTST